MNPKFVTILQVSYNGYYSSLPSLRSRFDSGYLLKNKSYRSPNSADERNLSSHRIATFTESLNVLRYPVMDPALMCTSTGDGEQTINQIQTRGEHGRFIFFYGPDADGRSTDLQSDCLGSIPTVSTMINTVASC